MNGGSRLFSRPEDIGSFSFFARAARGGAQGKTQFVNFQGPQAFPGKLGFEKSRGAWLRARTYFFGPLKPIYRKKPAAGAKFAAKRYFFRGGVFSFLLMGDLAPGLFGG